MDKQTTATMRKEGTANCGPKEKYSIVQVLFDAHSEHENAEHENVRRYFWNFLDLLDGISDEPMDAVKNTLYSLCASCEYAGFIGGMQTAVRLMNELNC